MCLSVKNALIRLRCSLHLATGKTGLRRRGVFTTGSRVESLALSLSVGMLSLGLQSARAGTYYWDTNDASSGFGTASGAWGTDPFWSTDSNGGSATANPTITTADSVFFGTDTLGLAAGTITGPSTAQGFLNMTFGAASGAITLSGGTLSLATPSTITVNNTADTISTVLQGSGAGLTKAGSGTLTLAGANTYTGATNVNSGTLALSGDSTGTTGQLIVNNAGILQFGDGTSTSGSSSNSGTIYVSNTGTVQVNKTDGGTVANQIASNPNTTTTLSGINAAGTTNTFTATEYSNGGGSFATNSTNAGAILAFSSSSGAIDLKGTDLTVDGAGDTLFTNAGSGIYSSSGTSNVNKNGTGMLIYQGNQGYTGQTRINAGAVRVDIAQTNGGTYFVGNGGTTTTAASLLLGGGVAGLSGGVTFNRGVSVNPGNGIDRTIGGTNTSGTNTYSGGIALDGDYGENRSANLAATTGGTVVFSGVISGAGQGITKTGGGTIILSNANTFSGNTIISGGTLQLGNGGTTGSLASASAITNNATLAFNRTNTLTQGTDFAGVIGGSGAVNQNGTGTTILSGANTYTGATTVNAGALLINGSVSSTAGGVNVTSGATLGGGTTAAPGTIAGATTINFGGRITGGTDGTVSGNTGTIGTLNFSSPLTINGTYVADVSNSSSTSDLLRLSTDAVNGVLTIGAGSTLTIGGTVMPAVSPNSTVYVLATYAAISGTFTNFTAPSGYTLNYGAHELDLEAIPEPATWLAGWLLLSTVGYSQRRRLAGLMSPSNAA